MLGSLQRNIRGAAQWLHARTRCPPRTCGAGLRTNLFGLDCPFHCTSPRVGALLPSCWVWCLVLDFALGCSSGLTWSVLVPLLRLHLFHLLTSPLLLQWEELDLRCWGTCMRTSHDGVTEAFVDLLGLRVTEYCGGCSFPSGFLQFLAGFPGTCSFLCFRRGWP